MSKGSKSRNRGIPSWHVGKLVYDDVTGTWEGTRSGKLLKQRGLNITRESFDFITDAQRAEMIKRRME